MKMSPVDVVVDVFNKNKMINLTICWKAIAIIVGILGFFLSIIAAAEWYDSEFKYKRIISQIIRIGLFVLLVCIFVVVLIGLYFSTARELC